MAKQIYNQDLSTTAESATFQRVTLSEPAEGMTYGYTHDVASGISDGNFSGFSFTQGGGNVDLGEFRVEYTTLGCANLVFRSRQDGGTTATDRLRIQETGEVINFGGFSLKVKKLTNADYPYTFDSESPQTTDCYLGLTDVQAASGIIIPNSAGMTPGRIIAIKDEVGICGTNNVTISFAGGQLDGQSAISLTQDYDFAIFQVNSDSTGFTNIYKKPLVQPFVGNSAMGTPLLFRAPGDPDKSFELRLDTVSSRDQLMIISDTSATEYNYTNISNLQNSPINSGRNETIAASTTQYFNETNKLAFLPAQSMLTVNDCQSIKLWYQQNTRVVYVEATITNAGGFAANRFDWSGHSIFY